MQHGVSKNHIQVISEKPNFGKLCHGGNFDAQNNKKTLTLDAEISRCPRKNFAPTIETPRKLQSGTITSKQGEDLDLSFNLTGKPKPFWSWEFTPEGQKSSSQLPDCEGHSNKAALKLRKLNRQKRGIYSLHCWNEIGEHRKDFKVNVEAPPSKTRNVKLHNEDNSYIMSWKVPLDDGGKPITNYVIQGFCSSSNKWKILMETSNLKADLSEFTDLYAEFRVIAQNKIGMNNTIDFDIVVLPNHHTTEGFDYLSSSKNQQTADCFDDSAQKTEKPPKSTKELVGRFGECNAYKVTTVNSVAKVSIESKSNSALLNSRLIVSLTMDRLGEGDDKSSAHLLRLISADVSANPKLYEIEYRELVDFLDPAGWMKNRSELSVGRIVKQILQSVKFLHDRAILHLSLHPIFLALDKNQNYFVHIFGFPYSTKIDPDAVVSFAKVFTEFYPPEVVNEQPVGRSSDVWSIGAITEFMLTGNFQNSRSEHKTTNISSNLSTSVQNFINICTQKDPTNRLTIDECLAHRWFQKLKSETGQDQFSICNKNAGLKNIKTLFKQWRTVDRLTESTHIFGRLTYQEELLRHPDQFICPLDTIDAAPVFLLWPRSGQIQKKRGENVTLQCTISAISPPVVTWCFMDQELRPSVKYRLQYTSSFTPLSAIKLETDDKTSETQSEQDKSEQVTCSLKITNCCLSDTGEYTCHAQNSYGNSSISVYVDIV